MTRTVIGYAARYDVTFHRDGRLERFARGCFRQTIAEDLIAFGINHQCCRCRLGRSWQTEPHEALLDWTLVLASTRDGSLRLDENGDGLMFEADIRTDAVVQTADLAPISVYTAIARAQCLGTSLHAHGGDQIIGRRGIPADVVVYSRLRLQEISLLLPPSQGSGSPGTWVRVKES